MFSVAERDPAATVGEPMTMATAGLLLDTVTGLGETAAGAGREVG